MALKTRFAFFAVLILCVGVCSVKALAAESAPERCRVFLLRFITAQQGIEFLADVNITNVSKLNDSNKPGLLVTASQEDLLRASALLTLVDSREKYVVRTLLPASEARQMPAIDVIQSEINSPGASVSIGTFFNLPGGSGYRAIVDVHDGVLIAVAPVAVMDKIVAVAQRAKQGILGSSDISDLDVLQTVEPNQSPDKLFNELLGSIAEAEKGLAPAPGAGKKAVPQSMEPKPGEPRPGLVEPNIERPRAVETEANSQSASAKPEFARRSYEPEATNLVDTNETLELALPEKLEVIQLLDLIGKYLNLNYVYDPKQLQGKEVYLKVQGPVKVKELYPLAESVLKFTGLVMSRKGNLVSIVPIEGALDIDPALIDADGGKVEYGDVVVTRIFQLNYVDTAQAKAVLEGMKLGAITELPGGTLIVTGYAYRMNRVEQLLSVIDKPGKPRQFKFRQLKHTTAKMLAPKIKQLVEQMGDISIAVAKPGAQAQPPARRVPTRQPPTPQAQPAMTTAEATKSSVYLDADERTNSILMIGQDIEIAVVENLINALDVEQQDLRSMRMYEIQHVDASEVRRKLEELGIVGAGRSTATPSRITARTTPAPATPGQPPTPTPTPAAGSEAELPTEEMQVVVIESTNSLLVNASPEQHAMIATIIAYVDSESIQQAIPYKVYPLQNQPPDHVAEVLQKLIQEVVHDKEGKVEKVVKKTEEDIIIVPDPNTFSLIVYASKKNQDWIADLIKTLDRRRPQVLIDVTLVEITKSDTFDLDLEMATKLPQMAAGGHMDYLGALLGGAGDSNGFLGKKSRGEAFVSGGTGRGFYSDQHIQALLTAMESKGYGRILAKPKILVNDGQVGIIKTTDTTNVPITSAAVVSNGTTVPGSTTYQAYNAGITLTIQPNISEGDLLLLIVKLDRTDFGATPAAGQPPDTLATNVDTIVTVPNNKTIVLGGLLKLNQSKGGSKVPLLGDIPLVGGLFRSTSDLVTDSKLYVFVKANILRPEETIAGLPELERISERSRNAFEKSEDDFQKYQDWPGLKPPPVDPEHVLDAE
ncbi:MAG: secretin N-terminal domain-containing protein [Sedimentisphaerales bacterium]|jgi:type II secretory pathway component GspD/PulD (secretin)